MGRAECSIQQSFLFSSFHTEGSRESQHRPAVCILLSTCIGASASCSCLLSFAVKASLIQTNTATDSEKSLKRKPARVAVMFLAHSGSRNVHLRKINKVVWLSGLQSAQMPTRCHCFSALGHI